ncbi:sodium-coupled monocarboxylate transporter 1-like [Teleopsis dalmanni]|uniref:sodium-coupled monocarboxylate transporter 1-like n=1 Tax=Teleopsis dalmanni TaxID=139649 RepID=UPI0018CD200F|nr:sodium-coupled monocarboxylate transporter 1-like [Teleopsis dalmanni]
MARELNTLGWDYLMFALFIALTVLTPLWKRLFGRKKQRSKADYVFATGSVSIFAIMISIARGALGVRTILGYPSELFYYGSGMWEIIYGTMSAYPIVCFVFVPVYFSLGITSVYQYIDLRETSPNRKSHAKDNTASSSANQSSYNNGSTSGGNYNYNSANSAYYGQQGNSTYPSQSYDNYYNHWQYSSNYSGYGQWSGYGNYY